MKLLLDANLSWRLTKLLKEYCDEIIHVDNTPLPHPAKDSDIWKYAKSNDYIIITNDEDYLNLLLSKGFPPKVILLRTGNQSTKVIAELLEKHRQDIGLLHQNSRLGILEIY